MCHLHSVRSSSRWMARGEHKRPDLHQRDRNRTTVAHLIHTLDNGIDHSWPSIDPSPLQPWQRCGESFVNDTRCRSEIEIRGISVSEIQSDCRAVVESEATGK